MNTTPAQPERYEALDADRIIATVQRLAERIEQRFGSERGLYQLCLRLNEIASQARHRSQWISQPIRSLRVGSAIAMLSVVAIAIAPLFYLRPDEEHMDEWSEYVQLLEPGINVIVLIGAVIFFLNTLEIRIKRRRALQAIHEIRSVAHIIDMHQLTKDPERTRPGIQLTTSSPKDTLSPFELGRYLDYCSEMLSLTGKIAALYVQHFDDAVALASANEAEQLCTGLSRKIWQKIMILQPALKETNSR